MHRHAAQKIISISRPQLLFLNSNGVTSTGSLGQNNRLWQDICKYNLKKNPACECRFIQSKAFMLRKIIFSVVAMFISSAVNAQDTALRVAVLGNSMPMSYLDAKGELTGFSIAIIRALCEEIKANCQFKVITLDSLVAGEFDVAAIGLLDTPERRAKILLTKPFFRSASIWFTKQRKFPGTAGIRIAAVAGSAQAAFLQGKGWKMVPMQSNDQIAQMLMSDLADAGLVPMPTAISLMQNPGFSALNFQFMVMDEPGLAGDACFGVAPNNPELKKKLDTALDRIKRNGRYDKINSEFLPFRVN
jgi:ABC-type amino acid transport substrate-binding protein